MLQFHGACHACSEYPVLVLSLVARWAAVAAIAASRTSGCPLVASLPIVAYGRVATASGLGTGYVLTMTSGVANHQWGKLMTCS